MQPNSTLPARILESHDASFFTFKITLAPATAPLDLRPGLTAALQVRCWSHPSQRPWQPQSFGDASRPWDSVPPRPSAPQFPRPNYKVWVRRVFQALPLLRGALLQASTDPNERLAARCR